MENLPPELNFQIWKDLPTKDILNLCETNSNFKQICDNDYTWTHLLERDFGINYQGYDPKLKYAVTYTKDNTIKTIKKKIVISLFYEDEEMFTVICSDDDYFFRVLIRVYI